jgi:5-methyltetrahydrofolate--homocysteine methyltransferase
MAPEMSIFGHTLLIGERINPTGRKALAEKLAAGDLDIVAAEARAQAEAGCDFIDVNVGAPGVDEVALLRKAAPLAASESGLPVCVDSSDPAALVAALADASPGWMVNSVTGDDEHIDTVLPAAVKAGAYVIGMAKDHTGIPETVSDRMKMAEKIALRCDGFGLSRSMLLIDFLTLPVATSAGSTAVTLECLGRARDELGCRTVLGASNVSFGMPIRSFINSAFLSMAIASGLDAAIIDPLNEAIVSSILASDVLAGKDRMSRRLLKWHRSHGTKD